MSTTCVARRIIHSVCRRAKRMRYPIVLRLSPDDAAALLEEWQLAEAAGIEFLDNGIVVDGVRFTICAEMRDSSRFTRRETLPLRQPQATHALREFLGSYLETDATLEEEQRDARLAA